jgi:hypothetical protein
MRLGIPLQAINQVQKLLRLVSKGSASCLTQLSQETPIHVTLRQLSIFVTARSAAI